MIRSIVMLVLLGACPASAQSVVRLDAQHAHVDAEAMARAIEASGDRVVVALDDPRGRRANASLTVHWMRDRRWTIQVEQDGRVAQRVIDVTDAAAVPALARASVALLRLLDELGVDLVDPFRGAWDPLRAAIEGELLSPYDGAPRFVHAALDDPFAPVQALVDLDDPWAGR